jgi:peptide/nickel transport system substrate-binding protein
MAKYTKFDLEGAKALLAKAGFKDVNGDGFVENPDGTKIGFDIISPAGWSDWNDGAAIVAQGLQKIGINAKAKATDLSLVTETWKTGNHDVLYTAYGSSPDIWEYYFDTIGDTTRVLTSTWWSITQNNYVNKEMSDLIAKMPSASDAELKEITSKVEQFFAQNMINIPILHNGNWFVYNDSRFTGWATKENPKFNPANCNHDSKLLQLMDLRPVEKK